MEAFFLKQLTSFTTYWLGLRQSWAPAGTGEAVRCHAPAAGGQQASHRAVPRSVRCARPVPVTLEHCPWQGQAPDATKPGSADLFATAGTWSATGFIWEDGSTPPPELPSSQADLNSDGYSHWVKAAGQSPEPNGEACVYSDRVSRCAAIPRQLRPP